MIDWDKPIETHDGKPARVLCRDLKRSVTPLPHGTVGLVIATSEPDGSEWPRILSEEEANILLRNVRQKVESGAFGGDDWDGDVIGHATKKRADDRRSRMQRRIACIKVKVEGYEGQFDE